MCRRIDGKGGQVFIELLFVLAVCFKKSGLVLREEFGGFSADLGGKKFKGVFHDWMSDGDQWGNKTEININ